MLVWPAIKPHDAPAGTGEEGLDWEYEEVEAEGGGNESG